MILEAKYIGPYANVTVPGFKGKTVAREVPVKLRIRDGYPIGGCWEITKGETEYKAARAKLEEERQERIDARIAARKERAEAVRLAQAEAEKTTIKNLVESGERDLTEAPKRKTTKPGKV